MFQSTLYFWVTKHTAHLKKSYRDLRGSNTNISMETICRTSSQSSDGDLNFIFGVVGCNFERVSKTRTTYDMTFRRKVRENEKFGRPWRRWDHSIIYSKYFKWLLLMCNTNQWKDFLIRTKSGYHNKRILFQKLSGNFKDCIIA